MENNNFFNFTADAVAYINEVKWVTPKKGNPFMALKVCILEGQEAENKINTDLIVRGKQALGVLQELESEWPQGYAYAGPRWFAGLRIGSLDTKPYLSKDGTPKAVLSGRLIAIKHLKIGENDISVPECRTNVENQDLPQTPQQRVQTKRQPPLQQQQRQNQRPANPQRQYVRRGAA